MTRGTRDKTLHAEGGFTLIELLVVIAIIAIIAPIAVPELLEARKSGNESSAVGDLRTLVSAQELYKFGDKDEDGVPQYASALSQLSASGIDLIGDVLGSGEKQGYMFDIHAPPAPNDQLHWSGTAEPAEPCLTGERYFYVDETGVIRFRNDGPAGADDPEFTRDGGSGDPGVSPCDPLPVPVAKRTEAEMGALSVYRGDGEGGKEARQDTVKEILSAEGFLHATLSAMDENQSGTLSFGEVLGSDSLSIARELASRFFPNASDESIGSDVVLAQRSASWLAFIGRFLRLGTAHETEFPEVPIADLLSPQQPPGQLPPGDQPPSQQPPGDQL